MLVSFPVSDGITGSCIAVAGSRRLRSQFEGQIGAVAEQFASAGHHLVVGCCVGVDECIIEASARFGFGKLHVKAAFGPGVVRSDSFSSWCLSEGSCVGSACGAVEWFKSMGGFVEYWCGGGPRVPISARLSHRTRAVVMAANRGVVLFFSSARSRGTHLAGRLAVKRGLPVLAYPLGFDGSALPSLGAGAWVEQAGGVYGYPAWRWVPAATRF